MMSLPASHQSSTHSAIIDIVAVSMLIHYTCSGGISLIEQDNITPV